MAYYHFQIKNIGRRGAKSAVASVAYRSCDKLFDEEQGKQINYSGKQGLEFSEVILCENAPKEYANRETLWNEVQKVEKTKDARFAREFVVAIPVELNKEQRRELIHNFAKSLADEGMCVDVNIHNTGKGNPHAHIMVTTRGIDENRKWKSKEKKVYELDSDGKPIPIIDKKTGKQKVDKQNRKQYKRVTIEANDWNKKKKCIEWRQRWREYANRYLDEEHKIDERSYKEQGKEQIPTVHEGYYAHEKRKKIENGDIEAELPSVCKHNNRVVMTNKVIQNRKKKKYGYIASSMFSFTGDWHGELSEIFLTKDKKVAFVDIKNHILVRKKDAETVLSALKHAQEKWGSVKIHGSKEYIDKCIELAIRNDITITNPELQEQIEAKKQALAKQEQQNNDFIERKEKEGDRQEERIQQGGVTDHSAETTRPTGETGQGDRPVETGKTEFDYAAERRRLADKRAERGQRDARTGEQRIDYEAEQRKLADIRTEINDNDAKAETRYQQTSKTEDCVGLGKQDIFQATGRDMLWRKGYVYNLKQTEQKNKEGKVTGYFVTGHLFGKQAEEGQEKPKGFGRPFEFHTKTKPEGLENGMQVSIQGQIFSVSYDKITQETLFGHCMVGQDKKAIIASKDIFPDSFERAAYQTRLFGQFVKTGNTIINKEVKNGDGELIGYSHKLVFREIEKQPNGNFKVDKDGKVVDHLTSVEFMTHEKVDFEKTHIYEDNRRSQIVGVRQTVQYTDKEEQQKTVKVIKPIMVRVYPPKELVKTAAKEQKQKQEQKKGKSR